jgi:hypothetical protein
MIIMLRPNIKLKLFCIFCLILTQISILVAYFNPSHGYELSLYKYTPSIVWISLLVSIFGGIVVVIYILYKNLFEYYNYCFLGIYILLFNRVVLIYIPYIRGYYSWRGDNFYHIGILKDTLLLKHIPNIIYPITHVLLSELVYITGISIEIIVNYSTALFSVFYVISIYLLATSSLVTKKEQILAVTSIACVLFNSYNVFLMPNGWSILYLPIVLFLYLKSLVKNQSMNYTILFFITLILYPFFHPLSTVMLILMLVIIGFIGFLIYLRKYTSFAVNSQFLKNYHIKNSTLSNKFYNFYIKRLYKSYNKLGLLPFLTKYKEKISGNTYLFPLIPITPILLEITIFLPWLLSFQQFNTNIKMLYVSIITDSSPDIIASMSDTIQNKLKLTHLEFIDLLINSMGDELIFLMLFLLSVVLLLKYSNSKKITTNLIVILIITLFIGLLNTFALLNIIPGLQNMGSGRFQSYLLIFTPIFAGFVLSYVINKRIMICKFNLAPIFCGFIILIASIISIYGLYPSPYIITPNPSITKMDINEANWFLTFKNPEVNNVFIMSPIYRFGDGILGIKESKRILGDPYLENKIPDHFNYTISKNLGNSYTQNKYSVITKFDIIVYDTVWKNIERYNEEDFEKLENDTSVVKLHSNGEDSVYYIYGTKE